MGRRSKVITPQDDLSKLSRTELDDQIDYVVWRFDRAPTSHARKWFFALLTRLEAEREERFGVEAPVRSLRARQS